MSEVEDVRNEAASKEQMALLEQFATATRTKVLTSQADLDTKDRIMDEMLTWCKEQGNVAVLRSATILSCDPTSRTVQNCKSLMLSKGIHPGPVYAATKSFVSLMLASGEESENTRKQK